MPAGRPACITVRSHPEAGAFFTRSTTTMLKTGNEHLQSLRDGRVVYSGSEKVDDVTTHPAFRNGARSIAEIDDMKAADPRFSFAEGKERYSAYFLRAKTREDLLKRTQLHRAIADMSHGLLGRSPDHVSSFVTGMAMNAAVFGEFEKNLLSYYEHMRREDVYGVYAVIPPQAARNPEFYQKQNLPIPTLRVVREDDAGVVISGMKMLATGAVFANEIWIGTLIPRERSARGARGPGTLRRARGGAWRDDRRAAPGRRGLARRLQDLQPALHVRGAQLVHREPLADHRRAARAVRRRHLPDAGRHHGDARSCAEAAVRNLLADAAARRGGAHEALQARVGPDRLGVRRAASAVREVLRRRLVHRAQPQLP